MTIKIVIQGCTVEDGLAFAADLEIVSNVHVVNVTHYSDGRIEIELEENEEVVDLKNDVDGFDGHQTDMDDMGYEW